MASKAVNEELNVCVNQSWRNNKNNGKKLWDKIDWKGKAEMKVEKIAAESEILKYFKSIFQSIKTSDHPIVSDIMGD